MKDTLPKLLTPILDLLYPDNLQCICCGDEIMPDRRYSCCIECFEKLPFVTGKACHICGVPMERIDGATRCDGCISRRSRLAGGISVMCYEGEGKRLVQAFKYKDKRYLVRPLADMMHDLLKATYIDDVDLLVPVPVHVTRRWLRGFNHAEILTRRLSEVSGIPWTKDLVIRRKRTRRLARLTHEQRATELERAFEYHRNYEDLKGHTVAIVDDIFTTGATAEALTEVLLQRGAGKVLVLTLCVTKVF